MITPHQAVKKADKTLKSSAAGKKPNVQTWWKSVQWAFMKEAGSVSAECADNGRILVYANAGQDEKSTESILTAFGMLLFAAMTPESRFCWQKKLCRADEATVLAFNARLNEPNGYDTFAALANSFKGAVPRLVASVLAKMLLVNGVALGQARGIDVRTYGATAEFAKSQQAVSIGPLVSAYADSLTRASYGHAFSQLVVNDLKFVRESTVATSLRDLVSDLAESVR